MRRGSFAASLDPLEGLFPVFSSHMTRSVSRNASRPVVSVPAAWRLEIVPSIGDTLFQGAAYRLLALYAMAI